MCRTSADADVGLTEVALRQVGGGHQGEFPDFAEKGLHPHLRDA